jgi:hypothetical protein
VRRRHHRDRGVRRLRSARHRRRQLGPAGAGAGLQTPGHAAPLAGARLARGRDGALARLRHLLLGGRRPGAAVEVRSRLREGSGCSLCCAPRLPDRVCAGGAFERVGGGDDRGRDTLHLALPAPPLAENPRAAPSHSGVRHRAERHGRLGGVRGRARRPLHLAGAARRGALLCLRRLPRLEPFRAPNPGRPAGDPLALLAGPVRHRLRGPCYRRRETHQPIPF